VLKADNLPPSCAVVMKSGNLNFLEPSGPVQACNGTWQAISVSRILKILFGKGKKMVTFNTHKDPLSIPGCMGACSRDITGNVYHKLAV